MPEIKKYPLFFDEVYEIVAQIPYGKVMSYGGIAKLLGKPGCARRVGQAMWSAPKELSLPCHRVVNSVGRTAPNWSQHRQLLENEGVVFRGNGCVDMKKCEWKIEGNYEY